MDSIFSVYCGIPSLAGSKVRKAERPRQTEVGEGKGQGGEVKGLPGGFM